MEKETGSQLKLEWKAKMRGITILGTSLFFAILSIQNCEGSDAASAFAETPIVGKIMLAKLQIPVPPDDVAEVINKGTISLADLRKLATSGSGQQRFWAIYCIGKMSRQMHDHDFLTKLEQSETWNKELPDDEAIWIRQMLQDAKRSIHSHATNPDKDRLKPRE